MAFYKYISKQLFIKWIYEDSPNFSVKIPNNEVLDNKSYSLNMHLNFTKQSNHNSKIVLFILHNNES